MAVVVMPDRIVIPKSVLLVEIVRRCLFDECNGVNSIGMTKEEAIAYRGFECIHCESWNDDQLSETDIPEWWPEIYDRKALDL
jgi:hypothetical protein